MEKNLNKTNQKSLNSHIDSINLDNDIKSVKQLVAQVVENINGLEMSFLNASTIQNLDQKTKEGEKLLEELERAVTVFGYGLEMLVNDNKVLDLKSNVNCNSSENLKWNVGEMLFR